jgi:hypothetical protein
LWKNLTKSDKKHYGRGLARYMRVSWLATVLGKDGGNNPRSACAHKSRMATYEHALKVRTEGQKRCAIYVLWLTKQVVNNYGMVVGQSYLGARLNANEL